MEFHLVALTTVLQHDDKTIPGIFNAQKFTSTNCFGALLYFPTLLSLSLCLWSLMLFSSVSRRRRRKSGSRGIMCSAVLQNISGHLRLCSNGEMDASDDKRRLLRFTLFSSQIFFFFAFSFAV